MAHLTRRREARLFSELRRSGDPALREALVRRHLPLARRIARRFHRGGSGLDDLFQVASYALVKAVDGFDPDRGLAFSSYATPTIAGELKRHARDASWGLHVPRGLQERALDVERAIGDLTAELGRSPAPREIATATGLSPEDVLEALEAVASLHPESLDARVGAESDAVTRLDTLGAPDPRFRLVEDVHALAPAVRELPQRERKLLSLRFGEELPQSEIARRLGISQMHVSRLLRKTLDELAAKVDEPEKAAR